MSEVFICTVCRATVVSPVGKEESLEEAKKKYGLQEGDLVPICDECFVKYEDWRKSQLVN